MKNQRILLVDSAENSRRFYALALRSQGYEVVSSPTLAAVEEVVRTYEPAAVILDMKLVGANAYDLSGKWRALYANLVIILLAERDTSIQPAEQRWAINRGATDLLLKHPSQVEALMLRVNQLVRSIPTIDIQALQSALKSLAPLRSTLPSPQIQHPAKSGLLNGLQSAWNSLQSKTASAPEEAGEEGLEGEVVMRYRGSIIRRTLAPTTPATDSSELTSPEENLVRYRGSFIRRALEEDQSIQDPAPPTENFVRYRGSAIPAAAVKVPEASPSSDQES